MGDREESETEVGARSGGRTQKSEASGAVYYASKPVEQKGAKSAERGLPVWTDSSATFASFCSKIGVWDLCFLRYLLCKFGDLWASMWMRLNGSSAEF
jgi:hypothetical protein